MFLAMNSTRPNLVFVFADQWRAQAAGYAGDPNVKTPFIDEFAAGAVNLVNAVSGCPVCSPYRASLLTGQYPLRHGLFVNDQPLKPRNTTFGEALKQAGYQTAYVGKWHVHGRGRSRPIPREDRMGFDYWRVLECTHDYQHSRYYADDEIQPREWDGYDAEAQTREACRYLRETRTDGVPFALFLSWGPPHDPYTTAPARFQSMYDPARLVLRPNVKEPEESSARQNLAGYYAHVSALDECFQNLIHTLDQLGLRRNTVVVLTSDHGDMLGSQGCSKKQVPFEESIRVPFLLQGPGLNPRPIRMPVNAPDIMPSLLSLCGVVVPDGVEGDDLSGVWTGREPDADRAALLASYCPFHERFRKEGAREYRGVRTARYTFVKDLTGPWLLFDNQADPYQLQNLCHQPGAVGLIRELDGTTDEWLRRTGDDFRPGREYLSAYGVRLTEQGDVFYE